MSIQQKREDQNKTGSIEKLKQEYKDERQRKENESETKRIEQLKKKRD